MPKYRDYFHKMLEAHPDEFEQFSQVHAKYTLDQAHHQQEFNSIGQQIQIIVRDWENRLCGHSEKGKFNKYSANLAEKFQSEIKASFPLYDFIGVEISQPAVAAAPTPQPPPPPPPESDPDLAEIDQLALDDDWTIKKLL